VKFRVYIVWVEFDFVLADTVCH